MNDIYLVWNKTEKTEKQINNLKMNFQFLIEVYEKLSKSKEFVLDAGSKGLIEKRNETLYIEKEDGDIVYCITVFRVRERLIQSPALLQKWDEID